MSNGVSLDAKIAHLEMVQAVIARMAGNSFLIKGWSVTIVAALFALAADKANSRFVYLAAVPTLMFWLLDGFFLQQERLYRQLYGAVTKKARDAIDFSMDATTYSNQVASWVESCFSKTLLAFHGTLLIALVIVSLVLGGAL